MSSSKFAVSPLAGALALALCAPAFAAPVPVPELEPTNFDGVVVHAARVDLIGN